MPEVKEKKQHHKIVVKTVGKPTKIGTGDLEKIVFAGEDGISYQSLLKPLFPHVVQGNTIDADIELRVNGQYENWTLTQIYKDGEPVVKAKKGYVPQARGRSPEEVNSIENQVRVKTIADLWVHDKLKDNDPLVSKLQNWLNLLPDAPQSKSSMVKQQSNTKPQAIAGMGENQEYFVPPVYPTEEKPQPQTEVLATAKELSELSKLAKDKDYKPELITAILLRHFKVSKAKELNHDQVLELKEIMEKGIHKGEPTTTSPS